MSSDRGDEPLKLKLDLNVLNHLGIGLYSSTPAVITEIIANSWDADASEVEIVLDTENDRIFIEDNGHGMNRDDVADKFLRVGYARRDDTGNKSSSGERYVMGRKGIGKLAMFSLANEIEIFTQQSSHKHVGARIVVGDLQQSIKNNEIYELKEPTEPFRMKFEHGTKIILSDLQSSIHKTDAYLRPRLARRFAIIGEVHNFNVVLNGSPIVKKDRGFYQDIQLLWTFDDQTKREVEGLASGIAEITGKGKCIANLDAVLDYQQQHLRISGFIATVDKPAKLTKLESNINEISVFSNGRVFQEDILAELGNSKVFNSYIVGEVHADFLDRDSVDRATANREAIKRDDPEFEALRRHLVRCLKNIEDQWDAWRRDLGYAKSPDAIPAIRDWISSFPDLRDRRIANRLMVNISNLNLSNSESENREQKKSLYKSTIVGFEKLRTRNQLEKLEHITDVLSPEFQGIFATLDDIEESYYHDITHSRLEVIEKFEAVVDQKELERVAQKYLFDHLWLLDPTWGRVSGSEVMEQTLTKELKAVNPTADSGARLDIAYRTSSGRHAIIELKRPGKANIKPFALLEQGTKYKEAMEEYLRNHPDLYGLKGRTPPIDVYFLVEKDVLGTEERLSRMLDAIPAQVFTYKGLITNAKKAYQEYIDVNERASRIDEILSDI